MVIPAIVKNGAVSYKVVAVGQYAFQSSEANSVTLPNTVIEVKNSAFAAADLKKVDMGTGLEVLGDNVFGFSRDLEEVSELPACFEKMTGSSFVGNFKLKEIKVSAENPNFKAVDGVLFNKKGNRLLGNPYGKGTAYVIPEGVDSISNNCFNTFQDLKEITFPSTLKYVGVGAFTYCNSMVNTNPLPDGVVTIGANAFSNCRKAVLNVPKSLEKKVNNTSFNNNYALKEIRIPSTIQTIGQQSFGSCSGATVLEIAEGVETIESYAFQSCSKIPEIKLPSTMTKVGGYAFSGCKGVKKVDIDANVTTIDVSAFGNVNPDTIICRAVTPPTYTNERYYMTGKDCLETAKVFVPKESIDAYKAAWMWSFFTNYEALEDMAGVNDTMVEKEVAGKTYYNMSGMEVAAPASADGQLYIVVKRYTDGSQKAEKVLNR